MGKLWVEDGVCAHPGFPAIYGREEITESWKQIFEDSDLDVAPEDQTLRLLHGSRSAIITCNEMVQGPDDGALSATNVFEKQDDGNWLIVCHHAGPLVTEI